MKDHTFEEVTQDLISYKIVPFLALNDLMTFTLVNKRFYNHIAKSNIWKTLYFNTPLLRHNQEDMISHHKSCRVVPCVESCDWVTTDDEEIFPEGWTYWDCGMVTVDPQEAGHHHDNWKDMTMNRFLRNKFHRMMKDVSFGDEFDSEGSDPVEGFLLADPQHKLDANWSVEDLRSLMKLQRDCPISEKKNVWKKLEAGENSEHYSKLKVEMEKHLVGIKCFIVGECGGLPFLILGFDQRTGALVGVASSVAWT